MQELVKERSTITPPDSINRHALRVYEHDGRRLVLDKTTDAPIPFYSLSLDTGSGGITIPRPLRVHGRDFWGEGLSWSTAEGLLRSYIDSGALAL